jgi:ribonuclease D
LIDNPLIDNPLIDKPAETGDQVSSEALQDSVEQAIPLLTPSAGLPKVIESESQFKEMIAALRTGHGPFALDAERASGYKFSARAYLIQIKRTDGGLHLLDPIPFGPGHVLFAELNKLLATDEIILHASTQDLPCLRELGINPIRLFDTELGGRLAGLPRVGLGPLLESLVGYSLTKEHSAVDWSTRPLPIDWLNYAALDVELLVELRDEIHALLDDANKLGWAEEEFASIVAAPPSPPRIDPWRRTSGMHHIKKREQLAVVKSLWESRFQLAQELDISPGRLLSDVAISTIALAISEEAKIGTRKELEKILRPIGLRSRWFENLQRWLDVIDLARKLSPDEMPPTRAASDALPPVKVWREKYPRRYAALTHARHNLELRSQELAVPLENMLSPESVRRICWNSPIDHVSSALAELGARSWQIEICAPILESALREEEPLEIQQAVEVPDVTTPAEIDPS